MKNIYIVYKTKILDRKVEIYYGKFVKIGLGQICRIFVVGV